MRFSLKKYKPPSDGERHARRALILANFWSHMGCDEKAKRVLNDGYVSGISHETLQKMNLLDRELGIAD
jgi:hypothetical protein